MMYINCRSKKVNIYTRYKHSVKFYKIVIMYKDLICKVFIQVFFSVYFNHLLSSLRVTKFAVEKFPSFGAKLN